MKRMNHPGNLFSSWSLGFSGWKLLFLIFSYVFASSCWFLLYFPRFFHPGDPINPARLVFRATQRVEEGEALCVAPMSRTGTVSWPQEGNWAPHHRGGTPVHLPGAPKKRTNRNIRILLPNCSVKIRVLKLRCLAFPGVLEGLGSFGRLVGTISTYCQGPQDEKT